MTQEQASQLETIYNKLNNISNSNMIMEAYPYLHSISTSWTENQYITTFGYISINGHTVEFNVKSLKGYNSNSANFEASGINFTVLSYCTTSTHYAQITLENGYVLFDSSRDYLNKASLKGHICKVSDFDGFCLLRCVNS